MWHEETRATASQTAEYGGRYLVIFDHRETGIVCDYIRNGGDGDAFMAHFAEACSAGFDPDRDLQRIGLANQTTMLMSESLEIGEMLKAAMLDRYGVGRPTLREALRILEVHGLLVIRAGPGGGPVVTAASSRDYAAATVTTRLPVTW